MGCHLDGPSNTPEKTPVWPRDGSSILQRHVLPSIVVDPAWPLREKIRRGLLAAINAASTGVSSAHMVILS